MKRNIAYIAVVLVIYAAIAIVFDFFPRSTVSRLEKRELAVFPAFSLESLKKGAFTESVSSWFSDTEPYRDQLMTLSMKIKEFQKVSISEENDIVFHKGDQQSEEVEPDPEAEANRDIDEYKNNINANENAKIANAGILVVGSGPKARALMAYGGSAKGGVTYAEIANEYKKTFGKNVNVYCMVIPTAIEFYCPDNAKKCTQDQRATIMNIFSHLDKDVKAVDIYTSLGKHAKEAIYLRTDHHWAPLGAYYAAQKFAKVANVPFKELTPAKGKDAVADDVPYTRKNEWYEMKVTHGVVGSMYGYSGDIAIKNAPEDFFYFLPYKQTYTTTYYPYSIDKSYNVTGREKPFSGQYFNHHKDGSTSAYCTFMGGDTKITVVKTATHNKRHLMILKDSFGNAIPGWLFYSFEEIHVVDFRYFTENMVNYVHSHNITDILFANNVFHAYSSKTKAKYEKFLTQNGSITAPQAETKPKTEPRPAAKPTAAPVVAPADTTRN